LFADRRPALFELVMYFNRRFARGHEAIAPGMVMAFRQGELPASMEQPVHEAVEAGLADLIELEPLTTSDITVMLSGLNDPGLQGLADALSTFTGGNPLFIVETLKDLIESEEFKGGKLPERFGVPQKVGSIITKRLEHLSSEALKLARLAAVARTDFDLELAGQVLQTDALDLAIPYSELEAAQIWRGDWFTHDLIYETLRSSTPDALRKLLHARTAKALEKHGGDPARIAEHWMAAGQALQAAPWWLRAADLAQASFRLDEAVGFIEQGVTVWEQQGDRQAMSEALYQTVRILSQKGDTQGLASVIERLSGLATTAGQKARVWLARAYRHNMMGDGAAAAEATRQGLEQARPAGDEGLELELLNQEAVALWHLERLEESAERFREVLARAEALGLLDVLVEAATNLAVAMDHLELRHQATPYHLKAVEYSAKLGHRVKQVESLLNLAVNQSEMGLSTEALASLNQALTLSGGVQSELEVDAFILGQLGRTWCDLGDYRQALRYQGAALDSARKHASWVEGSLFLNQARMSLILGAFSEAEDQLRAALATPNPPPRRRATVLVIRANLLLAQGQAADALLNEAETLMVPDRRLVTWINLWLTQAVVRPAQQGLEYVRRALEVAEQKQLNGLWIAAQTRHARLLLDLGQAAQALACIEQALERMRTYTCDFYQGEVLWTHCRALEANQHSQARQTLLEVVDWLMGVADHKVPPEYRQSFLSNNPTNRAILERYNRP
jgi:tetratricopeptide (TPR) repeat protein